MEETRQGMLAILKGTIDSASLKDEFYFKARDHFQNAIEIDPSYYYPYDLLIRLHVKQGFQEDACIYATQFVEKRDIIRQGLEVKTDVASPHIAQAMQISPSMYSVTLYYAYQVIAAVSFDRRDLEETARAIDGMVSLNPEKWESHAYAGLIFAYRGLFSEAAQELKAAVDIKPGSSTTRLYLAKALLSSGQKDDAIHELKAILAESPGNPAATYYLAKTLIADSNTREEGIRLLDGIREIKIDDSLLMAYLCYALHNALCSSSPAVETVSEPGTQSARLDKAIDLLSWRFTKEGEAELSRLAAEATEDLNIRLAIAAHQLEDQKTRDAAISSIAAVLRENPDHKNALLLNSYVQYTEKRPEKTDGDLLVE